MLLRVLLFVGCYVHATKEGDRLIQEAERLAGRSQNVESISMFRKAIEAFPSDPIILMQAGQGLGSLGVLGEARTAFEKASSISSPYQDKALYNLGFTYQQMNDLPSALRNYKLCISKFPGSFQCYMKAAYVFNQMGDYEQAEKLLQIASQLQPENAQVHMLLGDMMNNMKRWRQAVSSYQAAISLSPAVPSFHAHLADTLTNLGEIEEALKENEIAFSLDPSNTETAIGLLSSKREVASWTGWETLLKTVFKMVKQALKEKKPSPISPYDSIFYNISPSGRLKIAKSHAREIIKRERAASGYKRPLYSFYHNEQHTWGSASYKDLIEQSKHTSKIEEMKKLEKIRVGYVSRRFEDYAGCKLMLRVFGLHNREKFQVYTYARGADDGSIEREVVKRDSDLFRDLSLLNNKDAAEVIAKDKLDILVDYDGLHNFNNLALLAHRPSPIQVGYLGFAGTTGAVGVVDYIMSDSIITPANHSKWFSERLIQLPGTYQPQDYLQVDELFEDTQYVESREKWGLPKEGEGFVFSCFNRHNKIDPSIFQTWMEILAAVPKSVLWLYDNHPASVRNLQQTAKNSGVDPSRLVFGSKITKKLHLSRIRLADLVLDTQFYGAHTTASDALWMGVPVLTCPGQTFSSRVAASLATAAGIGELVVSSLGEYKEMAISLANNPSHLARLRDTLEQNRDWSRKPPKERKERPDGERKLLFFDMFSYVKSLEKAYRIIHEAEIGLRPKEQVVRVSLSVDIMEA